MGRTQCSMGSAQQGGARCSMGSVQQGGARCMAVQAEFWLLDLSVSVGGWEDAHPAGGCPPNAAGWHALLWKVLLLAAPSSKRAMLLLCAGGV